MKTALILFMVLAALTAQGADDLAGHYFLHVMEVGSELWLKPDGHFEYMFIYGAADYWAKGTWRRDGNAVVLRSDGKEEAPFRLLRSEAGKPGQIRVWVLGKNGEGAENMDVLLLAGGEPLQATTDSKGMAVFPDAPKAHAIAFEIPVYSVQAGPFEIDPSHKDYYFEINGDAIQQVLFKDERLTIDGKDLIMTFWKGGPPMHYEKQ